MDKVWFLHLVLACASVSENVCVRVFVCFFLCTCVCAVFCVCVCMSVWFLFVFFLCSSEGVCAGRGCTRSGAQYGGRLACAHVLHVFARQGSNLHLLAPYCNVTPVERIAALC